MITTVGKHKQVVCVGNVATSPGSGEALREAPHQLGLDAAPAWALWVVAFAPCSALRLSAGACTEGSQQRRKIRSLPPAVRATVLDSARDDAYRTACPPSCERPQPRLVCRQLRRR